MDSLLEPITVVELGSRIGVGAAGSLLSQLGGETIVIEPAEEKNFRKWRNRPMTMAGKASLAIDRNTQRGKAELAYLLSAADVVLLSSDVDPCDQAIWDGARPKTQIICDITAFGHTGPHSGEALSDPFVQALAGVADTTGPTAHPPCIVGGNLIEMHAAVLAASAIVAATRVRRLRQLGQRIDVALFDVGVTALINFLPLHITGRSATRCGNRHPLYGAWGSFPTNDGWILICAAMDDHWARLCEAMGQPELTRQSRFLTTSARLENFELIDTIISAWTRTLSVAECESKLINVGVSCGPIANLANLSDQPNVKYRQSIRKMTDRESGLEMNVHASPLRGFPVGGKTPTMSPRRNHDFSELSNSIKPLPGPFIQGDSEEKFLPCEGLRIVEIGQYTVAPLPSRIMGALGADVIKIEPPTGDAVRNAPPLRADGMSYIFAMSNTDKRGVVLDLRLENDREVLHRMLEKADALVENLKPGSLAKLGFSSEILSLRHPRLVYVAVNGFGTDSLYRGRPALDTVVQAMSGIMSLTSVDGVPTKAGISTSDNFGGQFALLALLAGIEFQIRSGNAVHFDLSMQEASAWATQSEWHVEQKSSVVVAQVADGFVAIEADKADLDCYITTESVDLSTLSRDASVELLSKAFPACSINTVGEAINHPQTKGRELLATCSSADGDSWLVFELPFKMRATPGNVKKVISRLGFDGPAVLEELEIGR